MITQCACCGTDITAPQFYKGKPYGWSCVLKQDPEYKRSRAKFVYADCLIQFTAKGVICRFEGFELNAGFMPIWVECEMWTWGTSDSKTTKNLRTLIEEKAETIGMVRLTDAKGKSIFKSEKIKDYIKQLAA